MALILPPSVIGFFIVIAIISYLALTKTIVPNVNKESKSLFSFHPHNTTILVSNKFSEFTTFVFEKATERTQLPITFFATNCDNGTASLNIDETLSLDILSLSPIIYSRYILVGSELTVFLTFAELDNWNITYLVFNDTSQALEFYQNANWSKTYTEINFFHSPFNYTLLANETSFYYIGLYDLMEFDGMINLTVQGIVIQYDVQYSMDEACTIDKTENNCSFSVQENRYSEKSSLCLFVSQPSTNFSNINLTVHSFYVTGSKTDISITFWAVIISSAAVCLVLLCIILYVVLVLICACKQRYCTYDTNEPQ